MRPLAILVPVLDRPRHVAPLVKSFLDGCPADGELVFVASPDDRLEIDAINRAIDSAPGGRSDGAGAEARIRLLEAPMGADSWPHKINFAVSRIAADWYLLAADDVHFHPGWWEATAPLRADPGLGVIGTNDLGSPRVASGRHAVHPLVSRPFVDLGSVDDPAVLIHPGYHHWCCDDELIATAKKRGSWSPCLQAVIEHLHPYWKKSVHDQTYARGESHAEADLALWTRRADRFFGLAISRP